MDTWLLLRNLETSGERNRGLYVLKARGLAHSNQIREFALTNHGVKLVDVYVGPGGILMGSARASQEAADAAAEAAQVAAFEEKNRRAESRRTALEAQIAALRAEIDDDQAALELARTVEAGRREKMRDLRDRLSTRRGADEGERTPAAPKRKKNGSEQRT